MSHSIQISEKDLAFFGGDKVRKDPLPSRRLFDEKVLEKVQAVFQNSWETGLDFGYQSHYEKEFTDSFVAAQGEGGFADAVSSGTAAVYVALQALQLKKGSEVIVSPVTDPGSVVPIVVDGMVPVVADSLPGDYNIGPDQFQAAITPNTKAAILTHVGGHPIEIDKIMEIANEHGIKVIEDVSQAPGALLKGRKLGCFGHLAAFSMMFSKSLASGGCGGVVYTKDEDLYWKARAYADRGKDFHNPQFDPKDPSKFLFPALNFNLDELSSAVASATLLKLEDCIQKRIEFVEALNTALKESEIVSGFEKREDTVPSYFFHLLKVETDKLSISKEKFAEAVSAEGIWFDPKYKYIVSEWNWVEKYSSQKPFTPNAITMRDSSCNLRFNEAFSEKEVKDHLEAILKVESVYKKV